MAMIAIIRILIKTEQDIVLARQRARKITELLGFENQDQIRIATVVSELARNAFQYAKGGKIEFHFDLGKQEIFIEVSDNGPGIANLDSIFSGHYESVSGMGVGLLGSKKLMDSFDVESKLGQGTIIRFTKELSKKTFPITPQKIGSITEELAKSQPESPTVEVQRQNRELIDAMEELRLRQSELTELNRELAETNRGVVALYAELDEKALSLQKANEVKTSFLSNMTHEFRTPLSSIISLTRLLLDRIDGELTLEQEKQVKYIRKSAEGLHELVNDLLDLAKVEAGKISMKIDTFSVEDFLGSLRGVFRPILAHREDLELSFTMEPGLSDFVNDEGKVAQVLRNLISNAVKYTEKGSVHVHAEASPGDCILFTVKDTGIGIPPESLEVIFEDFTQVDSSLQRKVKGTGLGLPLSRKLARLLGGEIKAQSENGKGSTFTLELPRVYAGADEATLIDGKKTNAGAQTVY